VKKSSLYPRILIIGLVFMLCMPQPGRAGGENPSSGIESEISTGKVAAAQIPVLDSKPTPALIEPAAPSVSEMSQDWWGEVQARLAAEEYFVTWQEITYLPEIAAAYQAPNRAQDLRTYFTPAGVVVIPRTGYEGRPPWRWQSQLVGWGRAGAMQPVQEATLAVQENRIEYLRNEAGVQEWLINGEGGLQQVFKLAAAPEGIRAGPLQFELELGGDLPPEQMPVEAGGALKQTRASFKDAGDKSGLRIDLAQAQDADGKALATWLELQGGSLFIMVDDTGAAYPIQVTPLIIQVSESPDWSVQALAGDGELGASVQTAGDVNGDGFSDVIVGAPDFDNGQTDEGRVFVYHGSVDGLSTIFNWGFEVDQANARLGDSVSTAGSTNCDEYADVIVGAPYYEDPADPEEDEGGVWLFLGSSAGLALTEANSDFGNQVDAAFGAAVGFAGDVNRDGCSDIIVGAPLYSNGQSEEGRVWVWHGAATSLGVSPSHDWKAEGNQVNGGMGNAVGTAGDVDGDGYADIIVGAQRYNSGSSEEGIAIIWYGSATGVNENVDSIPDEAPWVVDIDESGARFGFSVSTAGDVNGDGFSDVIVGGPYAGSNEGTARLYLGASVGISTTVANEDTGENIGDHLGFSVSSAGDVNGDGYADVLVGAPQHGTNYEGRAYLWYGHANGISTTRDWYEDGDAVGANFGEAVATAGDVNGDGYSDILIGAPGHTSGRGKVYAYYGNPEAPEEDASWTKLSNKEDSQFGLSVSTAGDVNGDGYADVIVGAPIWDAGQVGEGRVFVYMGSGDGLITYPDWEPQQNQANAQFGYAVAWAGDVNGDGYDDVIVGAPYYDSSHDDEGAAWVYCGSSSGLEDSNCWHKSSDQTEAHFGWSVAGAGDVNGDGYGDIIVGAPLMDHGQDDEGVAWVYFGSSVGTHSRPDWHEEGDDVDGEYGYSVGTAGDVNRDGYSDVIVGARMWEDDTNANEGRAWVYLGNGLGLSHTEIWHAEGNLFNAQLGYSVGTAGDVNGDGYSDVIVGGPFYGDDGLTNEGKVWVFRGSGSGVNSSASWAKEGGENSAQYGYSVGTAGDVNGDGYADIILGAPQMNDGGSNYGAARVYLGENSTEGLGSSPAWRGNGDQTGSWYGRSVASAGDVNGDGYADILVGAPQHNGAWTDEGKVYLYYGNGGRGVSLRPRQRHTTGDPLAHLGRSSSGFGFELELLRQSPFGRTGFDGEIELELLGIPFNGLGLVRVGIYSYSNIGTNSSLGIAFLDPGQWYHWRMRWVYEMATSPFLPASRWVTNPWNGWNEADLLTKGGRVYLPLVRK